MLKEDVLKVSNDEINVFLTLTYVSVRNTKSGWFDKERDTALTTRNDARKRVLKRKT